MLGAIYQSMDPNFWVHVLQGTKGMAHRSPRWQFDVPPVGFRSQQSETDRIREAVQAPLQ